ncbi:hypothetical protein MW887_011649 [Aspergillus wentii]|nr:hypothetical protein MW887_011649 [Aspergillus wentii]
MNISIDSLCKDTPSKQTYTSSIINSYTQLRTILHENEKITLDGESLDITSVTAVAIHNTKAAITASPEIAGRMNHSVRVLNEKLVNGEIIYGVTTGFGGSADTRTADYPALQKALIQHHNCAVVLPADRGEYSSGMRMGMGMLDEVKSHAMPVSTVRAAMLIRCNSLLRGHSCVRMHVVEGILSLLENDMTPVVPLRGSISASGDLTPLAYIAGALEGNPDIMVRCSDGRMVSSQQALEEIGLAPVEFNAKEGLGLLNGTAFSCGMASLVLFEANQLVLLAQVLTAMGTEALLGTRYNYHPFIGDVRPHEGQKEAAGNMFRFLGDSKMVTGAYLGSTGLAQDRYALRTSAQWIGPQLENLKLALSQVTTELNSTTDNPLLDAEKEEVHHGGNFQAASVTSAMEKTMTAMQMIGRMVFSQCSEIINPMLNKGLPPNLSADDPSLSFALKGVDINMASYMSELAYLAHPVSNHVQSAEMHNQGLNSLALIAGRYTGETVEVVSLMMATYLYVLCQAVDLRAMYGEFVRGVKGEVEAVTAELAGDEGIQGVWQEVMGHWDANSTRDLADRAEVAVGNSIGVVVKLSRDIQSVNEWRDRTVRILRERYDETREGFFKRQTTKKYLCSSSRKLYIFVRETLDVPMHRGLIDHPTIQPQQGKKSIGSYISIVYAALRDGQMRNVLLDVFNL